MYVGMRSLHANYGNFRRLAGGAMKLSGACFGWETFVDTFRFM